MESWEAIALRDRAVSHDRLRPQRTSCQVHERIDPRIDDRDQGFHDLVFAAAGDPGMELDVLRHMVLVREIEFLRLLTQPF